MATHRAMKTQQAAGRGPQCTPLNQPSGLVNQAMTDSGWTALMAAAHTGHAEVVRNMLEEGKAKVNQARTAAPMTEAVCADVMVRIMLEEGECAKQPTAMMERLTRALLMWFAFLLRKQARWTSIKVRPMMGGRR